MHHRACRPASLTPAIFPVPRPRLLFPPADASRLLLPCSTKPPIINNASAHLRILQQGRSSQHAAASKMSGSSVPARNAIERRVRAMCARALFAFAAIAAACAPPGCGVSESEQPLVAMLLLGDFRRPLVAGVTAGLADLGLPEGSGVRYCIVTAQGQRPALPKLARQLVRMRPAVICAVGGVEAEACLAAARGTGIPLVFVGVSSPVERGLARSLLQPLPNTTGVRSGFTNLIGKRLQLAKLIIPHLHTPTVLYDPRSTSSTLSLERGLDVAPALGLRLRVVALATDNDVQRFIRSLPGGHQVILATPSALIARNRASVIIPAANDARVPFFALDREACNEGAPFAYGSASYQVGYQAARIIHNVLTGTTPDAMPVERPADIGLSINLAAVRSLGIPLPPQVAGIADTIVQ